jgi:hypothetical protein
LRAEFRAWRASLPTALERDTLLWPEAIAESVVLEASRYLGESLPADFPARLAAKAYHLYPRHRHFHAVLNRPGNRGRDMLYVYMRHWTASWLKRERPALCRRLPWEYGYGHPLPARAARDSGDACGPDTGIDAETAGGADGQGTGDVAERRHRHRPPD